MLASRWESVAGESRPVTFAHWVLLVFVAYFAVLIGISVVRVRRMDDMSDYVLGGRRMGTLISALSAASSSSSGWTMLVFPALAFAAVLVTLLTPPPEREMTELFDRVNGPAAAWTEESR